jgi:hypothetical protein
VAQFQQGTKDPKRHAFNALPLLSSEKPKLPSKFRVYNRAREDYLSLEVTVVDTTSVPVRRLIEDLTSKVDCALWFTPYRGIPAAPGLPPFDLIYLDERYRVLQAVETYPSPSIHPLDAEPASALVLPVHTVFASRTLRGDQLEFRDASEPVDHGFRVVPALSRSDDARNAAQTSQSNSSRTASGLPSQQGDGPRLQIASSRLDQASAPELKTAKKDAWARFMGWLISDPSDRRRASRHPLPGLVAYHWTGGSPVAYQIGNISKTGFFLLTEERPFPGTIILMTLQRTGTSGDDPFDSIAIHARVIRWGPDGVGLELLSKDSSEHNGVEEEHKAFADFFKHLDLTAAG